MVPLPVSGVSPSDHRLGGRSKTKKTKVTEMSQGTPRQARFGPWSTAIGSGTNLRLSTFWKRRIAMLQRTRQSRFVPGRKTVLCLVIMAITVGTLPLIQFAAPFEQPAIGQENETRKAPKQTKAPTEGVNYLIIPFQRAQTDLQKTLVSSKKGAEVLIDGTAIVSSDGTINGNALLLDQLRKDLQPLADRKQNVLNVHIYHRMVGKSRNAKDLLYWSLQGFGRYAGFRTTKVFNHFQGQRFRFEDLVTSRKKYLEVGDEGDEPVSGKSTCSIPSHACQWGSTGNPHPRRRSSVAAWLVPSPAPVSRRTIW